VHTGLRFAEGKAEGREVNWQIKFSFFVFNEKLSCYKHYMMPDILCSCKLSYHHMH
jgi:hypothetical protein